MILLRLIFVLALVDSGIIGYGPIFGIGTDIEPLSECPVPDLYDVCIERCQSAQLECFINCENDLMCISECILEVTSCIEDCPCQINCLDGCDDCPNTVCQCEDMESNPDWNMCIDHNGMTMGRCVHACNGNEACELDCLAGFKNRQMDCPCEQNCVGGCPCENYPCVETTTPPTTTQMTTGPTSTERVTTVSTSTTKIITTTLTTTTKITTFETTAKSTTFVSSTTTSTASVTTTTTPSMPWTTNSTLSYTVLVLSQYRYNQNKPMTVDFNGNVDDDLIFEYGEGASAVYGCGATLMGEMWYFGGSSKISSFRWIRQVSKIEGCKLVRQGDLSFDFTFGSCNTFREPTPRILLCFGYLMTHEGTKTCHTFDGENYVQVDDSKYSHDRTLGLGNYRGKALTTGCNSYGCSDKVATELLDMKTMKWSDGPDYPFAPSGRLYFYSTTETLDAAYIIGGFDGRERLEIVAEFKNDQWRRLANLNQARNSHGSITIGGQTMIIGGQSLPSETPCMTEVWELENGSNKIIEPNLPNGDYGVGIALFVVEKDFCQK